MQSLKSEVNLRTNTKFEVHYDIRVARKTQYVPDVTYELVIRAKLFSTMITLKRFRVDSIIKWNKFLYKTR